MTRHRTDAVITHVHFDRLAASARRGLTEAARSSRVLASTHHPGRPYGAATALALGLLALIGPVAGTWGTELHPVGGLPLFIAGGFLSCWGLLAVTRRMRQRAALPFLPGTYLFDDDLVDARQPTLTIYPLTAAVWIEGVHRPQAGHTVLNLRFPGLSATVIVRDRDAATRIIALGDALEAGTAATVPAPQDPGTPRPFAQARADSIGWGALKATPPPSPPAPPHTRRGPGALQRRAVWVAALIGPAIGAGLLFGQNALTDAAVLARAIAEDRPHLLERYIDRGGRQADAVRTTHLPRARASRGR